MTDERYCVECGRQLEPGDKFCPACGAMVKDIDDFECPEEGTVVSTVSVEDRSGTLNAVAALTAIWCIAAIITGIYFFVDNVSLTDAFIDTMKDTAYNDGTMWDYFTDNGFGRDDVLYLYQVLGALFCASGIFAAGSACLDIKRARYSVSMILLALSIVFAAMGVVTLVIGIVVAVFLGRCKNEFAS